MTGRSTRRLSAMLDIIKVPYPRQAQEIRGGLLYEIVVPPGHRWVGKLSPQVPIALAWKSGPYSFRRESAGLAEAARQVWTLMTAAASSKVDSPAPRNIGTVRLVR